MLNICLILPLLTASINGFDSSLVNGKSGQPDHSVSAELTYARSPNSSFMAGILQSSRRKSIGSVVIYIVSHSLN